MRRYRPLLHALVAAEVGYVLIGSGALKRLHPERLRDYPLPDCDLLLMPGALLPFVAVAQEEGFAVRCWGEAWRADWGADAVAGKWYVRATQGALRVDATFECPFLDVVAAGQGAVWIDGVPVCPEWSVWRLKSIKDRSACRAFARDWNLSIPEGAETR